MAIHSSFYPTLNLFKAFSKTFWWHARNDLKMEKKKLTVRHMDIHRWVYTGIIFKKKIVLFHRVNRVKKNLITWRMNTRKGCVYLLQLSDIQFLLPTLCHCSWYRSCWALWFLLELIKYTCVIAKQSMKIVSEKPTIFLDCTSLYQSKKNASQFVFCIYIYKYLHTFKILDTFSRPFIPTSERNCT